MYPLPALLPLRDRRAVRALALAGLLVPASALADAGAEASSAGAALYATYCASCHGPEGRGDGPVAPALVTPPSDLTRLWRRYGSPLARDEVARAIDGRRRVLGHGTREMPVWGERLFEGAPATTPGLEAVRGSLIVALVSHLQTLQAGAPESGLPPALRKAVRAGSGGAGAHFSPHRCCGDVSPRPGKRSLPAGAGRCFGTASASLGRERLPGHESTPPRDAPW